MWNHLVQRLGTLKLSLGTLFVSHESLKQCHNSLEWAHHELAHSVPKRADQEPKVPDPPMFSGEHKDLLPFLTKCPLKFKGQPSQFPNERGKILYPGSRLEGPTFIWFQPLIALWPADSTAPPPPELGSFKKFSEALTSVYRDPKLQATTERKIRQLHQTTLAAEYTVRFESKKQY